MIARRSLPFVVGLLIVVGLLTALFGHMLSGEVYYAGDIARIYHPQRVALSQALAEERLPWWTPEVGIGYPMLASGEIGALYPLNWPLYLAFAPERALSLSILLHYMLAGVGFFWLGRTLGMTRVGALLGSVVYALGGFNLAHLTHISILSVSAWLPWLLACTYRLLAPSVRGQPRRIHASRIQASGIAPTDKTDTDVRRWPYALALVLLTALQFLAGHAQISLLGLLAVGLVALALAAQRRNEAGSLRGLGLWVGALALGTALALPQLLASAQLSALSQRAGGLEGGFFTSYSFHPLLTATFASPYLLGKPHPEGSIELMGYVGLLPLALASVALWRARTAKVWLYAGLIVLGLVMALGHYNPLYALLSHVPVLNLFRVPARYLLWTSLGLAVLAGHGMDRLQAQAADRDDRGGIGLAAIALGLMGASVLLTVTAADVNMLVAHWRWLPLLLVASIAALLLASHRLTRTTLVALAMLLLAVDLYAYAAVLDGTYNQTLPLANVQQPPRALAILGAEEGLYRAYTKPEILPALSVQRESLYPNIALAHGQSSANVYLPLVPQNYGVYLDGLDAQRLNRLNVRYYLIPQLLPVDEASELYDVLNPFAAIPYGVAHEIAAHDIVGIEIESYVSHAAALPDGEPAAVVYLLSCDGEEHELPLQVGWDTAEWAYARSDVAADVAHSRPPPATTFAARSGWPPEDHPGYTYRATWALVEPADYCGLRIAPILPEAFVRIERIRLITAEGNALLASHLIGQGDHSIIYRSEDVLIYENHDVLPRAYAMPLSAVDRQGQDVQLPEGALSALLLPAEIKTYTDREVIIEVSADVDALLVLADLDYPGWRATVNGEPADILTVDGVFRGVLLGPGTHRVRMTYALPW